MKMLLSLVALSLTALPTVACPQPAMHPAVVAYLRAQQFQQFQGSSCQQFAGQFSGYAGGCQQSASQFADYGDAGLGYGAFQQNGFQGYGRGFRFGNRFGRFGQTGFGRFGVLGLGRGLLGRGLIGRGLIGRRR